MYSVVIPARNERVNLWYTLHCLRMIWDEWPEDGGHEVIVVDSASTDGTERFLNDPGIHGWVRCVATDCTGPGPVRQVGAEAARGEIVFFADAHVLFSPDFFRRACRAMRRRGVWERVGSFHFPIAWNGGYRPECATHYELTLERDFWGVNVAGGFRQLREVAVMGHGCVAARREHFLAVGGYAAPFTEYGGDETYLDLKFARFGYRNYCYPGVYYLHCSQRQQNYTWSNDTLLRNNLISAYVIGGQGWAERVRDHYLGLSGYDPARVEALYRQALELAAEDHTRVNSRATFSLEEVLADFKRRGVPH